MVEVFREVRRVLRKDGTLWLNLGDSYAGSGHGYLDESTGKQATNHGTDWMRSQPPAVVPQGLKAKDLCMIPARVALALQADGWWLRSDIIWAKPNPMPESVTDRPTKSHEYIFLMTKSARYFYDAEAIKEAFQGERWGGDGYQVDGNEEKQVKGLGRDRNCRPNPSGRNARSVWTIATAPFKEAHFATFPPELARRCIAAGTSERGVCPTCGMQWERELEKENTDPKRRGGIKTNELSPRNDGQGGRAGGYYPDITTISIHQSCTCTPADPVPATVLDPFSGAATTGLVALRMGRKYIGIELNPEYNAMAERRLESVGALL